MNRRSKIAAAIVLVLLFYAVLCLWWWNSLKRPYAAPPPRTESEQKQIDRATWRIGRHVIIDGEWEIVIVMENGVKRIIRREL